MMLLIFFDDKRRKVVWEPSETRHPLNSESGRNVLASTKESSGKHHKKALWTIF